MNTIMWILGIIIGSVVTGSILYEVGRSRGYDEGVKHERKRINECLDVIIKGPAWNCYASSKDASEDGVVTSEECADTSEERRDDAEE